jgi:hypothetical protein
MRDKRELLVDGQHAAWLHLVALIDKTRRSITTHRMQPLSLAAVALSLVTGNFAVYTMTLSSPAALHLHLLYPSILS